MKSRLPFLFVIFTVVIDSMGIGLILPVMPDLIRDLTGQGLSDAALWGGALGFTYAAMQFLFSPTVGNLSDRFGRRRVMLLSLTAMGIDYLIMGFAGSIWLLFVARTISGITGATYATANAVIADISPPEKRAANFGIVGASFGIGFILGPVIGGLLGQLGPQAPFFAAGVLALANALFGYLVAPETLPVEKRRAFVLSQGNPFKALARVHRLPGIRELLAVLLLYMIGSNVYPVVWSYWTQEKFGWDVGLVGLSLAAFGLCAALVQGGLIRVALARFSAPVVAAAGLGMNAVVYLLLVWVPSTGWLFAFLPLSALGMVVMPALQGIMSSATAEDRQGELQGVVSSLQAVAAIVTPLIMTALFERFTGEDALFYEPSMPFVASAVLTVMALGLFLRHQRRG